MQCESEQLAIARERRGDRHKRRILDLKRGQIHRGKGLVVGEGVGQPSQVAVHRPRVLVGRREREGAQLRAVTHEGDERAPEVGWHVRLPRHHLLAKVGAQVELHQVGQCCERLEQRAHATLGE